MNNIFLCGFMGSGKSTVGRILAQSLRWTFVDLDTTIERTVEMDIPSIFAELGEARFRELESEALQAACTRQQQVIALGGGALLQPDNMVTARMNGQVVFLNCPFSTCYTRISQSDRPLVQQNTREDLERLYRQRMAVYRAACHTEVFSSVSPVAVAESICAVLGFFVD